MESRRQQPIKYLTNFLKVLLANNQKRIMDLNFMSLTFKVINIEFIIYFLKIMGSYRLIVIILVKYTQI